MGDTHLALRDPAGGEVKYKRFSGGVSPTQRYADTAGVGPKATVTAPKRRDHRASPHTDKVNADQPARHCHLSVMANASEMMGIRERENATAMLRYPFEGQRHGLHANDLPIASSTV